MPRRYFDYNPDGAILQSAGALGQGIANAGLGMYKHNLDVGTLANDTTRVANDTTRAGNDTTTTNANAGLTNANTKLVGANTTGKLQDNSLQGQDRESPDGSVWHYPANGGNPYMTKQPPIKDTSYQAVKDSNGNLGSMDKSTGKITYAVPTKGGGMLDAETIRQNVLKAKSGLDKYYTTQGIDYYSLPLTTQDSMANLYHKTGTPPKVRQIDDNHYEIMGVNAGLGKSGQTPQPTQQQQYVLTADDLKGRSLEDQQRLIRAVQNGFNPHQ